MHEYTERSSYFSKTEFNDYIDIKVTPSTTKNKTEWRDRRETSVTNL